MPVPTHDEARQTISPAREQRIFQAFMSAWSDWENCADRASFSRWPRTRANMLFERLAARLQEEFAGDPGVRFFFKDETIKIVFDNFIVARVKKANGLGVGENISTAAVTQFVEAQLDIDGLTGLRKVEIVYVLNRLQTAIQRVVAHARDGDMQLWVWTLGIGAEGAEIIPFPLPLPPSPSPPSSISSAADDVLKPKPTDKPDEASKQD